MKSALEFLFVNGIGRVAAGTLPPLLALMVTQSLSIQALAGYMVAAATVRFFLTPLLGPIVDRANALALLLKCEVLSAALSFSIAWFVFTGASSNIHWLIYFVCSAVIQSIEGPAFPKVMVQIVANDRLTQFVSWEGVILNIARLGGPILAGVGLLFLPPNQALTVFLIVPPLVTVPVFFLLCRRLNHQFQQPVETTLLSTTLVADKARLWASDVMGGFKVRWGVVTERYLSIFVFLELLIIVPTFGLMLPFLVIEKHWGNSWLGWLEASSGAGLVLGSALAPTIMMRCGRWITCVASAYGMAAGVALCAIAATWSNPAYLATALFVATTFLAFRMQAGAAQRRVAVPDYVRARFIGVHMTLNALAAQVGIAAAAIWLAYFSGAAWFGICAFALLGLAFLLPFVPGFRALVSMDVVTATGLYERAYPDAFKSTRP